MYLEIERSPQALRNLLPEPSASESDPLQFLTTRMDSQFGEFHPILPDLFPNHVEIPQDLPL
jgi:hypothetical protein